MLTPSSIIDYRKYLPETQQLLKIFNGTLAQMIPIDEKYGGGNHLK